VRITSPHSSGARRKWPFIVCLVAVAIGIYLGWYYFHGSGTATAAPGKIRAAIPVTVAQVQLADFPVYLNGLGTAEPYNTVTVRSRVDGQVITVAFKQGQMVEEGDILAQIDPRPYQAVLDQSLAKKAQDQATLKDAELNLQRYATLAKQAFASRQPDTRFKVCKSC